MLHPGMYNRISTYGNCTLVVLYYYSLGLPGSACGLLSYVYTASCVAVMIATYSASDVDRATVDFFLLSQLIGP